MTSLPGTSPGICRIGLAALASLWLVGCGGEGGSGSGAPDDLEDVELGDILLEQVEFENDRGEKIQGLYGVPDRSGPMPAVIVLHGSGGVMDPPSGDDDELEMGPQFENWAAILYNAGYAVLLPDSFASRGFYEWNDAPDSLDDEERLIMRVYDAHAALAFACRQPEIDCDRVAVMGFSNGGSVAAFSVHAGLEDLDVFGALPLLIERPRFALSIPYYPGCGFDGLLSTDIDDPAELYRPVSPVYVQHGDNDSLFDDCEDRLAQTEFWVEREGMSENPFRMYVYDAGHSFDSDPVNSTERAARLEARELTLDILANEL
jgi:dienelactone hydrolase